MQSKQKHSQHRTLAYQLATQIPLDSLDTIVGGSQAKCNLSMSITLGRPATQSSIPPTDFRYD